MRPAELFGQPGHDHARRVLDTERVHRLHAGHKQDIGRRLFQPARILFDGARVAVEILSCAELCRIDEYGDGNGAAAATQVMTSKSRKAIRMICLSVDWLCY